MEKEKKSKVNIFLPWLHLHGLICSRRAGPDGLSLLGPLRFAARPGACQQIRYREYWQIWLRYEAAAEQCSQLPGAHAERQQHPAVGITLFKLQFGLQSASSYNLHFSTRGVCPGSTGTKAIWRWDQHQRAKKICHTFSIPFHQPGSWSVCTLKSGLHSYLIVVAICISLPHQLLIQKPASKPASQSLRWKPPLVPKFVHPQQTPRTKILGLFPPHHGRQQQW